MTAGDITTLAFRKLKQITKSRCLSAH